MAFPTGYSFMYRRLYSNESMDALSKINNGEYKGHPLPRSLRVSVQRVVLRGSRAGNFRRAAIVLRHVNQWFAANN